MGRGRGLGTNLDYVRSNLLSDYRLWAVVAGELI